jgi:methylenetetrahydrofolate reductase (NADH)
LHDDQSLSSRLSQDQPARPAQFGDVLGRLVHGYTIELTPKEVARVGPLGGVLPPGTGVYLTAIPGGPLEQTVTAAARIAEEGLRPIPHLAVRAFARLDDVDRFLGSAVAAAGVKEVLVVAGSLPRPAGELGSSAQVLRSGLLERHGIRRVGVAGHPEGHPDVDTDALAAAIAEKNEFAESSGLDVSIVTQFAFSAEAYVRFERAIRAAGNRLPVHPGLPGVTSTRKLLRFAISCGVGPSLRVVRKQARGIGMLASRGIYRPDSIAAGIVGAVADDPDSLFRSFHFFPFGGFEDTVGWLGDLEHGRRSLKPPR